MIDVYALNELLSILKGVTPRQLIDLTDKGVITPAKMSRGQGTHRLYNFQNIFEICLCLLIRGRVPRSISTDTFIRDCLKIIRDNIPNYYSTISTKPPPFDFLLITYDDTIFSKRKKSDKEVEMLITRNEEREVAKKLGKKMKKEIAKESEGDLANISSTQELNNKTMKIKRPENVKYHFSTCKYEDSSKKSIHIELEKNNNISFYTSLIEVSALWEFLRLKISQATVDSILY